MQRGSGEDVHKKREMMVRDEPEERPVGVCDGGAVVGDVEHGEHRLGRVYQWGYGEQAGV